MTLRDMFIEEARKALRGEDAAVGTMSGNLGSSDKLVAPSTPKSRKEEGSDERANGAVVGMVRRTFSTEIAACPNCNQDGRCEEHALEPAAHRELGEQMTISRSATLQNELPVKPVRQTMMPGPSAIACALNYLGKKTTEGEVAQIAKAGAAEDVTPEKMAEVLTHFGFEVKVRHEGSSVDVRETIEGDQVPMPVFWWGHGRAGSGPHCSLIVGFDERNVRMMDPEIGLVVSLPWDQFLSSWFSFDTRTPSKDGFQVGVWLQIRP